MAYPIPRVGVRLKSLRSPLRACVSILVFMFPSGCSHIEYTRGTDTEKPKISIPTGENCKARVRLSKQTLVCLWKF